VVHGRRPRVRAVRALHELSGRASLLLLLISQQREPNRLRGYYGAARAAELVGDIGKAKIRYGKLVTLTADGDGGRPEVAQAKAFLAKP
jgi:hypothetical protein